MDEAYVPPMVIRTHLTYLEFPEDEYELIPQEKEGRTQLTPERSDQRFDPHEPQQERPHLPQRIPFHLPPPDIVHSPDSIYSPEPRSQVTRRWLMQTFAELDARHKQLQQDLESVTKASREAAADKAELEVAIMQERERQTHVRSRLEHLMGGFFAQQVDAMVGLAMKYRPWLNEGLVLPKLLPNGVPQGAIGTKKSAQRSTA
ncbi:hypothetical protein CPC08DRAFT_804011 [Agrocybe pediades]|nr:hypothetical protein CPC08DRAFT_804011 [Agrocybe pediades]